MLNKDLKYPLTSVVILQKDLTGVFHACSVSDVNILGSRAYSVKNATKRLSSSGLVLDKTNRQKHPSVRRLSLNVYSELQNSIKRKLCKPAQSGQEPSKPVLVTPVSYAKRLIKVLCILLTAGCFLLITKHNIKRVD